MKDYEKKSNVYKKTLKRLPKPVGYGNFTGNISIILAELEASKTNSCSNQQINLILCCNKLLLFLGCLLLCFPYDMLYLVEFWILVFVSLFGVIGLPLKLPTIQNATDMIHATISHTATVRKDWKLTWSCRRAPLLLRSFHAKSDQMACSSNQIYRSWWYNLQTHQVKSKMNNETAFNSIQFSLMVLCGILLFSIALCCIISNSTILHCIELYCKVFLYYRIELHCIALYSILLITLYYNLLYCILLYCIVLYCIALYCVVLYWMLLYCIVLCFIVLYCVLLYCIVLYSIVLYGFLLQRIAYLLRSVLRYFGLFCYKLHGIVFSCMVLYWNVLYCIVFHSIFIVSFYTIEDTEKTYFKKYRRLHMKFK